MIEIRRFQPEDQEAAQALILAGLKEYWGFIDDNKNPDLKDIATSFRDGIFLIAWQNGEILGTGAFLPRSPERVEVVRMSVVRQKRRQGIGWQILQELCDIAFKRGYKQVILETTATWEKAIEFYKNFGFQITYYADGDVYFALDLPAQKK
jgi:ribosomal protein S18 acetylase RimI-like enzyme